MCDFPMMIPVTGVVTGKAKRCDSLRDTFESSDSLIPVTSLSPIRVELYRTELEHINPLLGPLLTSSPLTRSTLSSRSRLALLPLIVLKAGVWLLRRY